MSEFLVTTDWLADSLNDQNLRVFDCTTTLKPDPEGTFVVESGRDAFDEGHIPGAGFLDLQGEFSVQDSPLRFTVPDDLQFSKAAGKSGITNDSHVVLYATSNAMWATRMWFLFRAFGHEKVSVLDGGFAKWCKEGKPTSQGQCLYEPAQYMANLNPSKVADKNQVLSAVNGGGTCILNALGREQHSGEVAGYGRPGHIAGSKNVPWSELLDDQGCFLPEFELQDKLAASGALEAPSVITYCGGGIAATVDLFALALLGMEDKVAVYDNSLSEWARDESLPMETG